MELLSAHGLPKDKKLGKFVINKADFLAAEPWDMRIGPAIWGKFADMIDPDDFDLKHHIYSELVKLPAKEFHRQMKEILAGTKQGKKIITDVVNKVRREFQEEEFNNALDETDVKDDDEDFKIDFFL